MPTLSPKILRLGTRGSLLARTQSGLVAAAIEAAHPGVSIELVLIKTSGDRITKTPLHEFGGKGLFTKELEIALLQKTIDFAVHSYKDVPTTMPLVEQGELIIAAVPMREDPRDLLVSQCATTLIQLPTGAKVGTGSLRRRCQILARRPDLQLEAIRGNIDTRLRKLRDGEFDAMVLALAGVRRAGLFEAGPMTPIDSDDLLPAPGQGALALQCRRDDEETRHLLSALDDSDTAACVAAERKVVALLKGDCLSPIGALARIEGNRMKLRSAVGARGGHPPVVWAQATSSSADPMAAALAVYAELVEQNAVELLHGHGRE